MLPGISLLTKIGTSIPGILIAKYFPTSSFWRASNSITKSIFWAWILQVKQILQDNCTIQIQNGNSSIWSTPWCTLWNSLHSPLRLPVTQQSLPHKISDLWNPETKHLGPRPHSHSVYWWCHPNHVSTSNHTFEWTWHNNLKPSH